MICDFDIKYGDIVKTYKFSDLLNCSDKDVRAGNFKVPCYDGKSFFTTADLCVHRNDDGIDVLFEKGKKAKLYFASHCFLSSEQLGQCLGYKWRQTDLPYGLVLSDERDQITERPYKDLCASIEAIAARKQTKFDIPSDRVDAENGVLYLPVTAKHRNSRWIDDRTPVKVPKECIKKKDDAVYTVSLPSDGAIRGKGCWGEAFRPVSEIAARMRVEARSAENRLKKSLVREQEPKDKGDDKGGM